jgi:hypothetical protein
MLSPTLNNVSIKQVLYHKHLGLIFSDKMIWSDHIDDIVEQYILTQFKCPVDIRAIVIVNAE